MRSCKRCGTEITTRYLRVRFCSPACWYASNRKTEKRICETCGEAFFCKPSSKTRTCGQACGGVVRRKRKLLTCKTCRKSFEKPRSRLILSRTFCSKLCYLKDRKGETLTCPQCGDKFYSNPSLSKRTKIRFCSWDCSRAYMRGANSANWRGGQDRHYRGPDWPQKSAEARKRDEYKCQVCGKAQDKRQKLSVDHIIPYRLVLCNELLNLISVCRTPCHNSKTSGAEACFLRGDVLGFKSKLNANGWPMERVQQALSWWGSLSKRVAQQEARR